MGNITIVTSQEADIKRGLGFDKGTKIVEKVLDPQKLSLSLKEFLKNFEPVLESTSQKVGGFSVTEIELNLSLSGEGGVRLIGEVKLGIETSITLKLSRDK